MKTKAAQVKEIRQFNRFYTAQLGLLNNHILNSDYSLSESRILYEIGERKEVTALQLIQLLGMDAGYMSRILKQFEEDGIIEKEQSPADGRTYLITLTAKGKSIVKSLHQRSDKQIEGLISNLTADERDMLVNAMRSIRHLLSPGYDNRMLAGEVQYRTGLQPGDMGYLIYLHGLLYSKESGYVNDFENYVLKTFDHFQEHYHPDKDCIWLATYNGQIIGSVAIIGHSAKEAQLRWFLVHPVFRGAGIGRKLLDSALQYCRQKGYTRVYLLTTEVQQQAIAMYKKAGFRLVSSVPVKMWGSAFKEERYELVLES